MFNKVLIAEDHEIRNLGVIKTLEELQITDYEFVSYCDDAVYKLKTAISEEKHDSSSTHTCTCRNSDG